MMDKSRLGIILMNLGSPDSTDVPDVKRYLTEFLMDARVIDYPFIFRKILVQGLIVPFRAPKSAEAYKTIWTDKGSPLVDLTRQQQLALQKPIDIPVEIAMRYGNPTVEDAYRKLEQKISGLEEVIAVPLYPHYAMSSYETAVIHARDEYNKGKHSFRLHFIAPFYNNDDYITALAENIRPHLEQNFDHLLFSYHGIPGRHIKKSDVTGSHCLQSPDCCSVASPAHAHCYRHQVITTTNLVATKLAIPAEKYSISFQSRLGKGWLEPFTDVQFETFPKSGIRKLLVVCPAFVSDCLETLEEIDERGRASFMNAGGESFEMIPCLNSNPAWIAALAGWINDYIKGDRSMILPEGQTGK